MALQRLSLLPLPWRQRAGVRGSIRVDFLICAPDLAWLYSLRVSTLSASIVYPVSASPVYWGATLSVPVM